MDKNVENSKAIKNRNRFKTFLTIFVIVFSVCLLVVEGFIYYQRSYLTPFWVNGQSMYPTLNGNAYDSYGNKLDESSGSSKVGYIVDYGVMDTHKSALNRIKRFDIVITKYSSLDEGNKIKRVVGLPGETVKFVITGVGHDHNGDLYINDKYYEQPISSEVLKNSSGYPAGEIKLGEDEYYVLGDNRNHSRDSRSEGPIKKEFIVGKAIALCATCEVFYDGQNLDVKNIKHYAPRFF